MSSSSKNFSLVPTLLLSLALGVAFGVFFLLLFGPAVKRNAAAQSGQVTAQTSQTQQASQSGQGSADGQGAAASGTPTEGSNTTQAATQTKVAARTYDYFTADTGADLYAEACQSCHMPGGKGANGGGGSYNYPALAGNAKLASAAYVQSIVLNGNGGMPGFAHYLSDEQVAKIVNYVRTELNDNADEVKASDIAPLRPPAEKELTFGESAG